MVLVTTCRVTFAFCSRAVSAILNSIPVPQFFPVLVHALMYILTKFQLYTVLFGVRPLFFKKTTGLLFEFDSKLYKQIPGPAIRTKFVPPDACIFMDYIKTEFLKTQDVWPWFWKSFIDDIFIWPESEESLEKFLEYVNIFNLNPRN